MSLPGDSLSTAPAPSDFLGGRALTLTKEHDFETGGVALNDASQGHFVQIWDAQIEVSRTVIVLRNEAGFESTIYEGVDITEISVTFDQNMRSTFAFVEADQAKLEWFDTSIGNKVITNFGFDVRNPRVSLDDKRSRQVANSDIILSYIRDGNLYYRQQRDRYETERLLASNVLPTPESYLRRTGMSSANRFQFEIFDPWSLEEQLAYTLSQAPDASATFTNPIPTVVPTIITPSSPTIWDQDNEDA